MDNPNDNTSRDTGSERDRHTENAGSHSPDGNGFAGNDKNRAEPQPTDGEPPSADFPRARAHRGTPDRPRSDHAGAEPPADTAAPPPESIPSGETAPEHRLPEAVPTAAVPERPRHRWHRRRHHRAPRDVRILRTVTVCLLLFVILLSAFLLSGQLQKWLLPSEYDPNDWTRQAADDESEMDGSGTSAGGTDTLSADTHRAPDTAPPDEPVGEPESEHAVVPRWIDFTESVPQAVTEPEPESQPESDIPDDASSAESVSASEPPDTQAAEPDTGPAEADTEPLEADTWPDKKPEPDASEGTGGIWRGGALYSHGLAYKVSGNGTCTLVGPGTCTDTHIIIPPCAPTGETVTAIAPRAFFGSERITAVTVPATVLSIGQLAFGSCPNLAYITVDPDNPRYTSRSGVLFTADGSVLMIRPPARTESTLVIPRSVICIELMAFGNVRGLSTIYYEGTAEDWQKLYIGVGNNALLACDVRFREQTEPDGAGTG